AYRSGRRDCLWRESKTGAAEHNASECTAAGAGSGSAAVGGAASGPAADAGSAGPGAGSHTMRPQGTTAPDRDTLIPIQVPMAGLEDRLAETLKQGGRLGLLTAHSLPRGEGFALVTLTLYPESHTVSLWETRLDASRGGYPSLTPRVPQAHWFERAIYDLFGLQPEGHPRFKSLILHEAWPEGFYPLREVSPLPLEETDPRRRYRFMSVQGEGIYEIPVGPIHAGIIEPGHFRFSCLGEIIQNLEIRLGYQHRGIEQQVTTVPWKQA